MSNHYAEYISIRRHILQCEADGEEDLVEKMQAHAKGDWVEGFQMSDDSQPLLIFDPYGSLEVGPADDGPVWMAGDVFGSDPKWMKDLGERLIRLAEEQADGG